MVMRFVCEKCFTEIEAAPGELVRCRQCGYEQVAPGGPSRRDRAAPMGEIPTGLLVAWLCAGAAVVATVIAAVVAYHQGNIHGWYGNDDMDLLRLCTAETRRLTKWLLVAVVIGSGGTIAAMAAAIAVYLHRAAR